MKLEIGQTWISESHPHESFKIYSGIEDSFVLSDMEIYEPLEFNELPEKAKIFFWERVDIEAFNKFVADKKGLSYEDFMESNKNTYPYAWAGESKKPVLTKKIKQDNMKLSQ